MSKKILLSISGSIAAYKAAELTSLLVKAKHAVKVVMTRGALQFISKLTFASLTQDNVYTTFTDRQNASLHIFLADWADLIIYYPSSASLIARMAHGEAQDLAAAICLVNNWIKPLIVAPAMHPQMYLNPATQKNLAQLRDWGATIFPPEEGRLACSTYGIGRLISPAQCYQQMQSFL